MFNISAWELCKMLLTSVTSMQRAKLREVLGARTRTLAGRKGRALAEMSKPSGLQLTNYPQPSVRTVRVHHSKCVATSGEMEMDVDEQVDVEV